MMLFGVFLPDFVSRGSILVAPELFIVSQFFHTPLGCFLQTLFISCWFVKSQRALVFIAITCGWIVHQLFDAFQIIVGPGYYYFLWPLHDQALSFDMFLSGNWKYVAVIISLVAIVTHQKVISWLKMRAGLVKSESCVDSVKLEGNEFER